MSNKSDNDSKATASKKFIYPLHIDSHHNNTLPRSNGLTEPMPTLMPRVNEVQPADMRL